MHAGVLLSLAGIVGYALWLWHHAGNPLYFGWLQTHRYGHTPIWHPWAWLKFPVWRPVTLWPDVVHEVGSLVLLVGALCSLPAVVRRLNLAYAVFVACVVAQSWSGTYDFAPAGRYLLPCVPVLAAVWAPWLSRRRPADLGVLALSGVTAAVLAAGFAGAFDLNW